MGLLRIVLQRSAADWLIVVATWLVIVCATTLVAIGVVYGDAVALTGLQRILADEPPSATSVVVELRTGPDELSTVEEAVGQQVRRVIARTGGELVEVARSESYTLPDQPSGDVTELAVFGSYAAIEEHARLADGIWPEAGHEPMEIAPSAAAPRAGPPRGAARSRPGRRTGW